MTGMSDPVEEALDLGQKIGELLHGRPREIQGAVLADLLAIWIAGHGPLIRDAVLAMHIDSVRALIKPNARIVAERYGLSNWSPQ
jgi:hypothetical protein